MVRKANKNDLKGILELYEDLLPEQDFSDSELYRPTWEEITQRDGLTYFVAVENAEIVATCNIMVIPNLTHGRRSYALIDNVVTRSDLRRKGYGRRVMERAVEHAKSLDCYKVMLLSASHRKNAHDFYKRIGFDGDLKRGFAIQWR